MSSAFTNQEKREIRSLFWQLTTRQLYDHINANREQKFGYTTFRTLLYKMGLKKCKILRWTEAETQYLLDNYKTKGNIEIAKDLSSRFRVFTKKNVEKKMKLLGIKRTRDEINNIIRKHKEKGTYRRANIKRWEARKLKEGEKRIQIQNGRPVVMIKVNGKLTPYARHRYIELHGQPPKGYKVYFKDMNPLNIADDNLIAEPAHGYTEEQRRAFRKHVRTYFETKNKKEQYRFPETPKPVKKKRASIPVRIDGRTVIYVKPGTNIEAFKQKYFNRISI